MEPVPPVGGHLERACVDRLAQEPGKVLWSRAREVGRPLERRSACHFATDGNREHELARRAGQALPRAQHRAAEVIGQARGKHPGVRRQALDQQPVEVGVATGASLHLRHEGLVRRRAQQGLELIAGLDTVERTEVKFGQARHPAHVRQPMPHRVPHAHLLAPQRQQHRKVAVARPSEHVGEYVERGLVGPLDVVDDEHHGSIATDAFEPRVDGHGGTAGAGLAVEGRRRHALRQPAKRRTQRHQGDRCGAHRETDAAHDEQPIDGAVGADVADEPGLADARVTADEQGGHLPVTGGLKHRPDPFSLLGPAHEGGRPRLGRAGHLGSLARHGLPGNSRI